MPQVDNLIRQLDRKSQQVEIEARVVQASRTFARDIGTQFGIAGVNTTPNSANVFGGNPIATHASPIVHTPAPPIVVGTPPAPGPTSSGSIPLISNFPANAPTSGLSFSHMSPNFALDFLITAAESKGVGKLLSSPQLVTQNNAMAIVKQGTQIPIQTTINNTISVQYVDAVLQLQVTPQITADGNVFMDVLVENTQIDSGIPLVNGIPALDTQSAQTKVLIGDGGTVVIGGVMVSQQQTTINEVPLLGSIPLIGHLFKETSVNVSIAGVALLPHAADSAWLTARATFQGEREETRVSSFFYERVFRRKAQAGAGGDGWGGRGRARAHASAQHLLPGGFTGSNAVLLVFADAVHLFTDGSYTIQAREEAPETRVHIVRTAAHRKPAANCCAGDRPGSACASGSSRACLNVAEWTRLKKAAGQRIAWKPTTDLVEGMREIKSAAELDVMRQAAKLASEVIAEAPGLCAAGRERAGSGRRDRLPHAPQGRERALLRDHRGLRAALGAAARPTHRKAIAEKRVGRAGPGCYTPPLLQ